jgi:hypothetical protein
MAQSDILNRRVVYRTVNSRNQGHPEIWEGVQMLQTIEVEIDAKGHIHPLEKLPLPLKGKSRALLTILPSPSAPQQRTESINEETPAYGVLTASRSVSLDEMETAIHTRGSRL